MTCTISHSRSGVACAAISIDATLFCFCIDCLTEIDVFIFHTDRSIVRIYVSVDVHVRIFSHFASANSKDGFDWRRKSSLSKILRTTINRTRNDVILVPPKGRPANCILSISLLKSFIIRSALSLPVIVCRCHYCHVRPSRRARKPGRLCH